MSTTYFRNYNTIPLVVTSFYVLVCLLYFIISGPHWMHHNGDVNYVYLFTGLDYLSLIPASINDQPALTVKLANAIGIGMVYFMRSFFEDTTLARDVITHSETYLNCITLGIFSLIIVSLYRLLKTCLQGSRSIEVFLIASLGMFLSYVTIFSVFVNKPEPYLIIAGCLLGSILIKRFVLNLEVSSLAIVSCLFIGILSKITFAPFLLPLIVSAWSRRHLHLTLPVICIISMVILLIWQSELTDFTSFVAKIAKRTGEHGSGEIGFYDIKKIPDRLITLFNINKLLIVSILIGLYISLKTKSNQKIVIVLAISYIIFFIFLLKNPASHYFILAYPISCAYWVLALQNTDLSSYKRVILIGVFGFLVIRTALYTRSLIYFANITKHYVAPAHIQSYYSSSKAYACFSTNEIIGSNNHAAILSDLFPKDTFYTFEGNFKTMRTQLDLNDLIGKTLHIEGTSDNIVKDPKIHLLNEQIDGIKRKYTVKIINH